jgi:ribonucleoside-diphosphate reductase alpha chain
MANNSRHKLLVRKRNGDLVPVRFDAITDRITELCETQPRLDECINPFDITKSVLDRIKNGITTSEIDDFTAELCAHNLSHPDYYKLASRLIISNHHKNLEALRELLPKKPEGPDSVEDPVDGPLRYSEVCEILRLNKDQNGKPCPIINDNLYEFVLNHKEVLDSMIILNNDFKFDFFGFKTLQNSYLLKSLINSKHVIVESPQHKFMRVSLAIHVGTDSDDNVVLDAIRETYYQLSYKKYTHASPTLYNAGIFKQQMFSCFIFPTVDSVRGIFKTVSDTADISKGAGGIGISISDVRGRGSYVRGTGGKSDGIVPMLNVFNETSRYINQGSRRSGSYAMYIEPWHVDILGFLEAKGHKGTARDLFYGLWIPNLFMETLKVDGDWYLMCPSECPGLTETYGIQFEKLYAKYISEGKYRTKVKAKKIFDAIIDSQIETGVPYMCYKDAVNEKTNHQNLGVIKSSNLCSEIMEFNSPEKYACCCLSSVLLPNFVYSDETGSVYYDYKELFETVKIVTKNLDRLIDINFYPVPETENSNKSERPIGIGAQGLADVFFKFKVPYDSEEARILNKKIYETIYFGAMTASCELAQKYGTYPTYEGSPVSKGLLQFDMWNDFDHSSLMHDWEPLRASIKKYGIRNSLVTCAMPTAATSIIAGCNECFEPISSNIYTRTALAGEFIVINKYLTEDLIKLGLWNERLKNEIIAKRGSIKDIKSIPKELKDIYKTCWEIPQKVLVDLSVDRAPFIDQSQSLNLFFAKPTYGKVSSAHMYGYSKGLKTGMYYLRSQPSGFSESMTIDESEPEQEPVEDSRDSSTTVSVSAPAPTDCEMCSG